MAVALAEPQIPNIERAIRRGDIKQARERIKFKPDLQTEAQRTQFVDDFHTIIISSESTNKDKENFTKAFKSQDKVSKLYIGQILLEQLEDEVRNTRDEKSIRAFLQVARLINLPKECALDKKDRAETEVLLKELHKIYAQQTAQLSPGQRVVLAAGAAGSLVGLSGNNPDVRQAAYEAARQTTPASTPDARTAPPGFDVVVDWGDQDGGLRVPDVSLRPRPVEKTIAQQEDERLVPHSVRALQNPELNRLYKEGCLDTKETTVNGVKVMVVDFVKKPGVTCDLKFPQVYEAYPVKDRLQAYKAGAETQIRVNQIDVTCAIHSFTIAAMIARNRANPTETRIVVNPFLYGEADTSLTPDVYNQLQKDLLDDPTFRSKYGADTMAQFARSSVINNATQRTDVTERVFRSIYGAEVNRGVLIKHPEIEADGRISFKQNSFSEAEWQILGQKYSFSVEGDKIYTDKATANKVFGVWLEKWYKELNVKADQNNKSTIPVLNMRYYAEGINHAYVVFGIKEVDGKKYFQLTEGLGGQISSYLAGMGAKQAENGTVLIPLDTMWNIGLLEAYTFTVDKPGATMVAEDQTFPGNSSDRVPGNAVASLSPRIETPRQNPEIQERVPRSEQFGFRVNSVEAIEKLPASIGMIRIAGNETALNPDGTIMNQENVYFFEDMLNAADKKGLKVVFVYNPKWFPGVTGNSLSETDLQKSREIIEAQMRAILKHPSVSHIEVGNEVDENKPDSRVRFWRGNMADYAKFFKIVSEAVQKTNQGSNRSTELILSAFSDPTGTRNPSERNYAELAKALKDNGVDMSKFMVAGHAYHLDQLEWVLKNVKSIFGAKELIITEVNVGRGERPAFLQEFDQMIELIRQNKVKALIHEWKPEMPYDIDYGGGQLAMDDKDPRMQIVMGTVANELRTRQILAHNPRNTN